MNSGIGGMLSFPILRSMWCVITPGTPGSPPASVARCRPGLPTVAILMCSWRLRLMASRPKKVKNRLASMPSALGPLAMISAGEIPSREPFHTMIETFSMVASMTNDRPLGASDAAAWLGDPGDLGGGLGRPLGEELVELLDGDAGGLAEHADGGAGSLGLVFGAHEPDDLPVPRREFVDALGLGDLWRHVLGPLAGFGEESFVADADTLAGVRSGGHVSTSWVRSSVTAGGGRGGIRHARAGRAAGGHGRADSGDVAAGKQAVPVELLEGELAEVVHAGLPQQGQAEAGRVVAGERFGVVVEVDQQGPAEAGLDEAVGVAVEGGGQRLATQELVDVGGQHVAFEMGNGSCFGGRDVGGVAEGEHVGLYRGLERAGVHRNEAELVAESG